VLGLDWEDRILSVGTDTSLGSNLGSSNDFELLSLDLGSDSSDSSSYSGNENSEFDSDMLEVSDSGDDNAEIKGVATVNCWGWLRRWVQHQIAGMYEDRYEVPCDKLPWGPSHIRHVLFMLKNMCPDLFREELWVSPLTFDALVTIIITDPVFGNNSFHPQMVVEEQLAITLYQFGHDGNAASLQGIVNWAATGKGTVVLVTHRVITSILRPHFMDKAVCFPTKEEKEIVKKWV
jgi:hypothetical protein